MIYVWLDRLDHFNNNGWYVPINLTHWGRVTHICVSKLTIIGSDNGMSPALRQAIIWTNVGILLIWPLGINFNEILIEFNTVSFKKMYLKMSYAKWRLFRLGLDVLINYFCIEYFGLWTLRCQDINRSIYGHRSSIGSCRALCPLLCAGLTLRRLSKHSSGKAFRASIQYSDVVLPV